MSAALALAVVLCCIGAGVATAGPVLNRTAYLEQREEMLHDEWAHNLASTMTLTEDEFHVAQLFNRSKLHCFEVYHNESLPTPPSVLFYEVEERITNSGLFAELLNMPKGANLHVHTSAMNSRFVVQNGTYRDDCYVYVLGRPPTWLFPPPPGAAAFLRQKRGGIDLHEGPEPRMFGRGFHYGPAFGSVKLFGNTSQVTAGWVPCNTVRAQWNNDTMFDTYLLELLTMNGHNTFGSPEQRWKVFLTIFSRLGGMIYATEFFPDFFRASMDMYYRTDGVMHVELRQALTPFFSSLTGQYLGLEGGGTLMNDLVRDYEAAHPGFSVRVIYSTSRTHDPARVAGALNDTIHSLVTWPDLVIGFDLVGDEYLAPPHGFPIIDYLDDFVEASKIAQANNVTIDYYFHAGESMYATNRNAFDATLLGTANRSRIGHAYNVPRYSPVLVDAIAAKDLCLEVCPNSNQILGLINDLREHTALTSLNEGLRLTIATDDAGLFGYNLPSYDWYSVLVAFELYFKELKQLVWNGVHCSTLDPVSKAALARATQDAWTSWVQGLVKKYPNADDLVLPC